MKTGTCLFCLIMCCFGQTTRGYPSHPDVVLFHPAIFRWHHCCCRWTWVGVMSSKLFNFQFEAQGVADFFESTILCYRKKFQAQNPSFFNKIKIQLPSDLKRFEDQILYLEWSSLEVAGGFVRVPVHKSKPWPILLALIARTACQR